MGVLLFLSMVGLISMTGKHLSTILTPIASTGDMGKWVIIIAQISLLGYLATRALTQTGKLIDSNLVVSLVFVALITVMLYGFKPELFPRAFSFVMP